MNKRPRSRSTNYRSTYHRSPSSSSHVSSQSVHPQLERSPSIKDQAARFFGVSPVQDQEINSDILWQRKRLRHLNRQYGINRENLQTEGDLLDQVVSEAAGGIENGSAKIEPNDSKARLCRALSVETTTAETETRESVFKIATEFVTNFVRGKTRGYDSERPGSLRSKAILAANRSFPKAPMETVQEAETSLSESVTDRPIIEEPSKSVDVIRTDTLTRNTTTSSMRLKRPEKLSLHIPIRTTVSFDVRLRAGSESEGESYPLQNLNINEEEERKTSDGELFYDNIVECKKPTFILDGIPITPVDNKSSMPPRFPVYPETPKIHPETPKIHPETPKFPQKIGDKLRKKEEKVNVVQKLSIWQRWQNFRQSFKQTEKPNSLYALLTSRKTKSLKRPRRQYSTLPLPWGGSFKKQDPWVKKHLGLDETYADDRPYFTYWVTVAQIITMILALMSYGLGTNFTWKYFAVTERSGDVLAPSISQVHLVVYEQNNIWIGPRYADLVHMGAKYTPCMRSDKKISQRISDDRKKESEETGCCISAIGCYQTSICSPQFSKLIKSINDSSYKHSIRGVCGQDPRYCIKPRSINPFRWSNDISKWPICEETKQNVKLPDHMKCEITGRPCCIQMHGQCRITTKEYCDFVKGYYHENATLCSQISCLSDICGMIPFVKKDTPDQYYRFFTPLFIHAGIIPCIVTVWIQFSYMRKFEMMIGWLRLSIIYFTSGVGGYIASALFVPYMPQVGPAGAQMGILGAMIINVCYNWGYLRNPKQALMFHLIVVFFLFSLGLLPFIDNFGLIFGFVIGFLLGAALIPYIGEGTKYRLLIVIISITLVTSMIILMILLFILDLPHLPDLSWMSCVSFGYERVCDQQSLQLKDWLPI